MDLPTFVLNALRSARADGLSPDRPCSYQLLWASDTQGYKTFKRRITVALTQPNLYPGEETQLWLDATSRRVYKSNNWRSSAIEVLAFEEVGSYEDMFVDTASVIPEGLATEKYVNDVLARLQQQGAISVVAAPVQSLTELRALDVSAMPDKQLVFVEDEHQLYGYDFQSTAAEDMYVVRPSTGVGRWVMTGPAKMDAGTF